MVKRRTPSALKEVLVPFNGEQLKIAVVQIAGSQSVRQPAFVNGRDTSVWPAGDEVPERCKKAERILSHIIEAYSGVNLVIFPEYSLPLEPLLARLQRFADQHGIVIVGGSDILFNNRGSLHNRKIYNQCPVFIPHHKHPTLVRKRDLAPAEMRSVDAYENHNPVFR